MIEQTINTIIPALAGGTMIGLSAVLMLYLIGELTGISGITYNALFQSTERAWRVIFLVGLVLGTLVAHKISGVPIPQVRQSSTVVILLAGFFVGFGTRLGSGCTSGHGVCGISRLSKRSIVATFTFFISGIITVFITHHII